MKTLNIVAVALIVAGGLGLAYGQFGFTKETQEARIGPLELTVQDRETVNIPQWASIAAIVAGALLLVVPRSS
ncbi:hypothetical protein [Thiobaca trueperi]|uniref:Uncharacterized protein n=1 Tax=Thiobaca trueperi TaxID=127458 RepID=A0A4R3N0P1_9GAMM|nr:hypothetical protein [Thiobaca trueperi]TCT22264.1 hypothetical protein EDC35_103363 [Thiobaca trueperi]